MQHFFLIIVFTSFFTLFLTSHRVYQHGTVFMVSSMSKKLKAFQLISIYSIMNTYRELELQGPQQQDDK